uniref:Protein SPEC3 n=1 Tax=Trichuris muris TaxID=70415 RepID=A0A5S6R0T9_TRIMR
MKRLLLKGNPFAKRTAKIGAEPPLTNGTCPKKPTIQAIGLTKLNDFWNASADRDVSVTDTGSAKHPKVNLSDMSASPEQKNEVELDYQRSMEHFVKSEPTTSTKASHGGKKTLNETPLYSSIPFLPLPVAIVSLLLNILLPGSGTILAGLAVVVVGKPRLTVQEGRIILSVVINICVGVFQFITTTFFLIGWFWSITWGGLLVMHALTYRAECIVSRRKAIDTFVKKARQKNIVMRRKTIAQIAEEHGDAVAKVEPPPQQNQQSSSEAPKRNAKDLWAKVRVEMVG